MSTGTRFMWLSTGSEGGVKQDVLESERQLIGLCKCVYVCVG